MTGTLRDQIDVERAEHQKSSSTISDLSVLLVHHAELLDPAARKSSSVENSAARNDEIRSLASQEPTIWAPMHTGDSRVVMLDALMRRMNVVADGAPCQPAAMVQELLAEEDIAAFHASS